MRLHGSFFRTLLITVSLIISLSACRRANNLDPFGWERIGEPFDSLTLQLEYAWIDPDPIEVRRPLVKAMREAAEAHPENAQGQLRADFWESRLTRGSGNWELAEKRFRRILEQNDSTKYPYIQQRIQWLLDEDYPPATIEWYNHLKAQAEFFEKSGDRLMGGAQWMTVANFLTEVGQYNRAEEIYCRADSLFKLGGFENMIHRNVINHGKVLYHAGRLDECERILNKALADSIMANDPAGLNILYENCYIIMKDTTYLFKAYDIVRGDSLYLGPQSYFTASIAGYYLEHNQMDSALYYSDLSMELLPYLDFPNQRTDVLAWRGGVLMALGREAEANRINYQRLEEWEQQVEENRREEVMNHEFEERLVAAERADDRRVYRARLISIIVIASTLLLGAIIFILQRRHSQRMKLKAMEQQLSLEKSQRRVLAMKLALDEKEQLIATIQRQLSEGDENGKKNARLESLLKMHTAGVNDERTTFMQTFSEVNPEFERWIRSQSDSLTASDIRLASMISVGLTNKQIASALGVRPESVKQARWRLRSKLNLDREESLENYLANNP